jgi:hypothetical protein
MVLCLSIRRCIDALERGVKGSERNCMRRTGQIANITPLERSLYHAAGRWITDIADRIISLSANILRWKLEIRGH